jgi:TonB-dependent starch-binding outer membrane protein SusC
MQSNLPIKRILKAAVDYPLLLVLAILFTSQSLEAQTVSLSVSHAPLKEVFAQIKKQTGYSFIYASEFLTHAKPVSFSVTNAQLEEVLGLCFKDQPIGYTIDNKFIVIKRIEAEKSLPTSSSLEVRGRVLNEKGERMQGVSVIVKGTTKATATDDKGEFFLEGIKEGSLLQISSVGYGSQEIPVNGRKYISVQLSVESKMLEETIIKGYYTTSKRLNTGNVGKITADQIDKQAVINPLQALQGRVPGLAITQSNGLPGSSFTVQIRGQNSIAQGSDPLIIIDGVPYGPNNNSLSQIVSALNSNAGFKGMSALSLINPKDIESIEVLKDADATSIYGSRGANGVILITTKKGKAGKTKVDINAYRGFSTVGRTMDILNTEEYVSMRREAFVNDNIVPDNNNAYDLLLWDTTRYTDFKEFFIGGRARTFDAQTTVGGGDEHTQFLIGGGYHRETTVFPGDFGYNRGSTRFSLQHENDNRKLTVSLSGSYAFDKNDILVADLSNAVTLVPNMPELYDTTGKLSWNYKGVDFANPLASLEKSYVSKSNSLNGNLQLGYTIVEGLAFSANLGYNRNEINEYSADPIRAQNPALSTTGSANFGNAIVQGWIVEPQIRYATTLSKGKLQVLVGGSIQRNKQSSSLISASGFANDNMLEDVNAASFTKASDNHTEYAYTAAFGRINYNWNEKYILNLTGRRDGSSRFGPGKQFSNFGAVGAAWIFSNENFFKKHLPLISYAKIRGSYGSSGNDQIGEYKFLSAWSATVFPYQGLGGLTPSSLYNPDFSWELNTKAEVGIEMNFFKDKLFFSTSYFRNRSSNQLVSYQLPVQTGFFDITQNFPALVQNTGLEIEVGYKTNGEKKFGWSVSFNLSLPKNKLIAFPGIEASSYSYLQPGQPLSVYGGFHYLGIDPQTGIYQFADSHGNATSFPSYPEDWKVNLGHLEPKYYGGFLASFYYKSFSLDLFFEGKKQTGTNYLYFLTTNVPGTITNQFKNVLTRWQKPGDYTDFPLFTQDINSAAGQAYYQFLLNNNDAKYSDASYGRLKNLSLSYSLPPGWLERIHFTNCRIFIQGQNLITLTNYTGGDPETKNVTSLPPLKTIIGGIQITF